MLTPSKLTPTRKASVSHESTNAIPRVCTPCQYDPLKLTSSTRTSRRSVSMKEACTDGGAGVGGGKGRARGRGRVWRWFGGREGRAAVERAASTSRCAMMWRCEWEV